MQKSPAVSDAARRPARPAAPGEASIAAEEAPLPGAGAPDADPGPPLENGSYEDEEARALAAGIPAQQMRLLSETPLVTILNLVNSTITALVLSPLYPRWVTALWLASFYLVIPLRLRHQRRFRERPLGGAEARRWVRQLSFGAGVTGCLWGAIAASVLISGDPVYHVFVAFVLGGMAAGAVLADAAYLPALFAFVVPAVLPAIVAFMARGGAISIEMGLMLAAFTGVVGIIGININRWIHGSARLQVMREGLTRIVRRRDAVLSAVARSASEILRSLEFGPLMPRILALIGTATGVSRLYLCENEAGADGRLRALRRYEWTAAGVAPGLAVAKLQRLDVEAAGLAPWLPALARGIPQSATLAETGPPVDALLRVLEVKSLLVVPILVEGRWWGEIGLDDCVRHRRWSEPEIDALRTLAEMIGSAILKSRTLDRLAIADRIIANAAIVFYRARPDAGFPLTFVSSNIRQYGYSPESFLADPLYYRSLIHPDDLGAAQASVEVFAESPAQSLRSEFRLRAADGSYHWVECHTRPNRDPDGSIREIEGMLLDVTDRKSAEDEIARLRQTDHLTGLPNRALFHERLEQAFAEARRGAGPFAVHYIDLDRFKDFNDTLGHSRGDALLKAVARRIRSELREMDLLARFGGDEFAILQQHLADPAGAAALASKVIRSMADPFVIAGQTVHITASIGISLYDNDSTGPEDMMAQADLALYRAKDAGRNQYHFHVEALDHEVRERVTLAEELRGAIERDELFLCYQPQVEAPTGKIVGLEALIRWRHPRRGLMLPKAFIPIAEKNDSILAIGRWAIGEVTRQIAAWNVQGLAPVTVSLNVSAVQLRLGSGFEIELGEALRAAAIKSGQFELELTETVLMNTTREHSDVVRRLHLLGVRVAIDDFGTGYSSLDYLRAYRVDRLKIAQEFVRDLTTDLGDLAIVRATVGLARELGMEVVAEGVENAAQLQVLVDAGCRYMQGHYYSPPVSARETDALLRRGRIAPAAAPEDRAAHPTGEADGGAPTLRLIGGGARDESDRRTPQFLARLSALLAQRARRRPPRRHPHGGGMVRDPAILGRVSRAGRAVLPGGEPPPPSAERADRSRADGRSDRHLFPQLRRGGGRRRVPGLRRRDAGDVEGRRGAAMGPQDRA
jgi:diguanylate cyclase (GGDEF)-like protein/PAS domain S-box-containing protein